MDKRYIVKHCSNNSFNYYEAHYSNGDSPKLFTTRDYGKFLKFTDLLKESGYKYIENEDEY